ncbi:hypothetical protein L9F63_026098, partial [Diploptera punctata]
METLPKGGIDILRLPSWQVKYRQSHILHSKCSSESGCIDNDGCCFVLFVINSGKLNIKIACADAWKESRMESGPMEEVKPFDWTFTTDYAGTLSGDFNVEKTETRIDLDKLRQREKILFYHDLCLFEDELHDNGTAVCSVKIRVMPSSFFILLRYFLRIDNVLLRINDTRFYHEFETDFILREYTSKEAKVQELNIPPSQLIDPSEVAQFLPLMSSNYEKLILPKSKAEDFIKSTPDGNIIDGDSNDSNENPEHKNE